MRKRVDLVDAPAAAHAARSRTPWRATLSRLARPILSATDWSLHQAVAAVLRHQPKPERNGLGGTVDRQLRRLRRAIVAFAPCRARRRRWRAPPRCSRRRAGRTARRSRPCAPSDRDHRHAADLAVGVEDARDPRRRARSRRAPLRLRAAVRRRPMSPTISATICLRATRRSSRWLAADAAVAHDDDAVGDGEDLGQAMRDEDDGDAVLRSARACARTAAAIRSSVSAAVGSSRISSARVLATAPAR